MDTTLLEAIAQSKDAVILRDESDIRNFLALQAEHLVAGAIEVPEGGPRHAVVYGLTAEGRALLALQQCLNKRRPI